MPTVTEAMVERLARAGVERMFGVPGGECNLDFIAAAQARGMDFVLTRTETSACIMACVTAELTGTPGVAMTTRGPGLAAATNGVAYADLDRAAMLLIADGYEDSQGWISHQRIDQGAILSPMLRAQSDLRDADPLAELDRLLSAAQGQNGQGSPPGPAYLEVCGELIRGEAPESELALAAAPRAEADPAALDEARTLLKKAQRPLILAGLQARQTSAWKALRGFAELTGFPVLTTYKAKGAMSERVPLGLGLYAGGVAEQPLMEKADLILLFGNDPVEGPPQPWRYPDTTMIELTEHAFQHQLYQADVSVIGPIGPSLSALADATIPAAWSEAELAEAKQRLWNAARVDGQEGIAPSQLVQAAINAFPADSRITIDAGAHMLPVLHMWQCDAPNMSLISRGSSTMQFALPAAIAASLADPERTTVCFTGDGGLMMCLGELGTAVEAGAKPIVICFNDSALTLIGSKQRRRQLKEAGVVFGGTNFAEVARGFGWNGLRVERLDELAPALRVAASADRATLLDVVINPDSYDDMIANIRG